MKYTVIPISLKAVDQLDACEFGLELQKPGKIVQALVQVRERAISVLAHGTGAAVPSYEFIPTLLVLIDPEAPKETRHFVMVPPLKIVESENELVYITSLLSPDGRVLLLFEEIRPDGEVQKSPLVL